MNPLWIWLAAALVYGLFTWWYSSWQGPLTPDEIETYVERMQASGDPTFTGERVEEMRKFLEADDGKQFMIVNLIRLHPEPVPDPETGQPEDAQKLMRRYTGYFMPQVFRRAGHPVFVGPVVGPYMDAWGVEPNPGWTFSGIVRYRSRRDLMELATDPRFAGAHVFKNAAMTNTLSVPVSARTFFGPRVWVPLVLGLMAALGHLFVGRPS